MSGGQTMPRSTPRLRVTTLANFAVLLVVPALYLEVVSLTRHLAPGNPFYAALDALGRDSQLGPVSAVFTAATLLGPVLAMALCLLAVLRLEWRREVGGFVTTVHVRDRLLPLATIGLSLGVLALLFLYAFFENFVPR
jgi:hypothetical protein